MSHRSTPASSLDREEALVLGGVIALFAITASWWALALWPIESAPAWLQRTRYVCFGVRDSGLPDAGGWVGLIGGPLGMLLILVTGWSRGLRRLALRARSSRAIAATGTALLVGCTALVAGAGVRVQHARAAWPELAWPAVVPPETYPRLDRDALSLALTSQSGEVVDIAELRGRPVLVTFAFAHCATICPLLVQHALRAQEALRGSEDEPAVLIVTLDPWRDRPSRLPSMAQSWGLPEAGAWVLSGSVESVEAVLDDWQVHRTRDNTTGDVTHPSLLYIVDRNGRLAYASTGGVDALITLIRRL